MDHGDPGNASYAGALVDIVIGHMALLGLFLACGSSAPVRIDCEGGTAAWVTRILVAPNVQQHGLPQLQEVGPIRVFF